MPDCEQRANAPFPVDKTTHTRTLGIALPITLHTHA